MGYPNNDNNHPLTKSTDKLWIERLAYLMDEQFRVPGTKFRFGLDPILNLIPFLGDMSGLVISAMLILTVAKKGASSKIVTLMVLNIVLDATIGAIPFIGQVFDFYYKANSRNIRLLKEHYQEGRHQGSGKGILIAVVVFLLILVTAFFFLLGKLFSWMINLF